MSTRKEFDDVIFIQAQLEEQERKRKIKEAEDKKQLEDQER